MIEVKFEMDEDNTLVQMSVKGHAEQNVYGQDIVCASASILAYTLAQNLKYAYAQGQLRTEPKIKLKNGDAKIVARAKSKDAYELICHDFCFTQTGFQLLAHNYPQYVLLKMFGEG